MRIHWFQHVLFEGLGSIEDWARTHGHPLTCTRFPAGDSVPGRGNHDALVIMGGPMSVHDETQYPWLAAEKRCIREAIADGRRVLGICLGAQLIAEVMGGEVTRNPVKEIGWFPVRRTPESTTGSLVQAFPKEIEAFHWHGETFSIPPGAVRLASSAACANQGFTYGSRVVGFQFHFETTRASAEALIANAADELVDGPCIQKATELLADDTRFARINRAMAKVLDAWAG